MAIKKLPEYLINRLKAGEIVERPSSVVKELVENSLDAGARKISITVNDGGKNLISVEDDGSGIQLSDMDLVLERYATSKIYGEQDLATLKSYGFRGEALASISEVAKTTIITKTAYAELATKMSKTGNDIVLNHLPSAFKQGTIIHIQDLFYNVPARLKFLKSSQTEFFYCYNHFVDVALYHYDKHFVFKKNDKMVFDVEPVRGLIERVEQLYKKDWSKNLKPIMYQDDTTSLLGVISDAQLTFGSPENIKLYVNGRPVQDKIMKKALLDAYYRQITPGEYPLAILFLDINPGHVDVNVHPRKLEVKFLDPGRTYDLVYREVSKALGEHRVSSVQNVQSFVSSSSGETSSSAPTQNGFFSASSFSVRAGSGAFTNIPQQTYHHEELGEYTLVGQLWNMYIVLQSQDALFLVDQHALAERIIFEKIKKAYATKDKEASGLQSELLLQPIAVEIHAVAGIEEKIQELNQFGFDVGLLSDTKIAVYAVPQIFAVHKLDIEVLLRHVFSLEHITFDHFLDQIMASKACKAAIKAGDTLSYEQMKQLITDGLQNIESMFVCQHGRPFFVKMDKDKIDGLFDR